MAGKNYIFYQAKTQFTNVGDALINYTLLQELRNMGELMVNVRGIPKDFVEELKIQESEMISCSELIYNLIILKHSILSLFNSNKIYLFSGLGDATIANNSAAVKTLLSAFILLFLSFFGLISARVGRSVKPLSGLFALIERFRNVSVKHLYVRDSYSLKSYKDMGVSKVGFCPDMSWLFLADNGKKLNENNNVGITFRHSVVGERDEKYIGAIIVKLKDTLMFLQAKHQAPLKMYVFYQVEGDRDFCKEIYESLKSDFDITFLDRTIVMDTLDECYNNFAYHISNRLHSILVGYKYGSFPIALIDTERHVKISSLLTDAKLDALMLDVYSSNIKDKVNYIADNKQQLFNALLKVENESKQQIKQVVDVIFNANTPGEPI